MEAKTKDRVRLYGYTFGTNTSMPIVFYPFKKKATKRKAEDAATVSKKSKLSVESPAVLESELEWSVYELVAESQCIDEDVAKNTTELFEQGNTIPFIARYRKHITGNMEAERLRDFKEMYDKAVALKDKIHTVIKSITKLVGVKMEPGLRKSILAARSLEELDLLVCL